MRRAQSGLLQIAKLQAKLQQAALDHATSVGHVKALATQGKSLQEQVTQYRELSATAEQAGRVLSQYADERQAEVVTAIESVCSAGLTSVFDKPISLHLRQTVRARRSEVDVTIESDGIETSVLDARGGGLAAVVGILLRFTILLLDTYRRILILDEPFAHLSEQYSVPMAQFLHEEALRQGVQIILVTHNMEFAEVADKVITVVQKDGKSSIV